MKIIQDVRANHFFVPSKNGKATAYAEMVIITSESDYKLQDGEIKREMALQSFRFAVDSRGLFDLANAIVSSHKQVEELNRTYGNVGASRQQNELDYQT